MQLTVVLLLLLLATPAAAQMPTHPPFNQTIATGETPAAARSAVNAGLAATRLSPAAKAAAQAHKDRARVFEELQKTKGGK